MKIVNPSAAGQAGQAGQKSGVAAPQNPFKKVMNGVGTPKAGGAPAKAPTLPSAVLQPKPALKKLPGGVSPLAAGAAKTVVVSKPLAPPNVKALSAAAATRATARAEANNKAENLVDLRAHAMEKSQQRYDTRLVDLICQELKAEFGNELSRPQAANSDKPVSAPVVAAPAATVTPISEAAAKQEAAIKAASAVQLIEKIEAFVKSQRPGLALTLDGSLGARVEIERLGPKEVALRVVGKNGPPAPEDIGRIREEMRARGLKVGALSVA